MKNRPNFRLKRRPNGFTLIEVMTATVIMIVIITFALKIAVDTTEIYDNGMSNLKTASEARPILSALAQDFESAIIRNDNNYWLEINHPEAVGNVSSANCPEIMLYAPDPGRVKHDVSTPPEERIPGDICAIKYKIAHRSPFDNPGDYIQQIYALYRASIDAQGTFGTTAAIKSPLEKTLEHKRLGSDIWVGRADVFNKDGKRGYDKSLRDWATEIWNYKATGVVSISLVIYYQDNSEATPKLKALVHADMAASVNDAHNKAGLSEIQVVPYQQNIKLKAGKIIKDMDVDANNPKVNEVNESVIVGNIKSIEIAVTVLSPDGDRILRARQKEARNPKISETVFNDILRRHGFTFCTTVPISQH